MHRGLAYWTLAIAVACAASPADAAAPIDFNRDIRPILSNNCFFCHGPDENERQGGSDGLRLDTAEGALADQGGRAAVTPGKPDTSELIRRITTVDADELMPPAKTGKKLTAREVSLLTEWIRQGAPYAQHWSYNKPSRPSLPQVRNPRWSANPVDLFILSQLDHEQLEPAQPADPYTLIRRLTLDLTGLPPSIEEVDAFVSQDLETAYPALVDKLLASPAFGEHWARLWLDLARYADSAGYADDPSRVIWAYRDYVIRSFNANKSFDQFTLEQMAGDLLPTPSEEQLMATAFHRNTLTNSEGGTNDEEFRNVAIVDRVNTTMAVWMGTSMACAQCHTHKFDPISQEDYFRFYAILNNTDDADRRDESPLLSFYTADELQKRSAWEAEIAAIESKFQQSNQSAQEKMSAWKREFPQTIAWNELHPKTVTSTSGSKVAVSGFGRVLVTAGAKNDTYIIEIVPDEGDPVIGLRLEALVDDSIPGKGPGHAANSNFVISRIAAQVKSADGKLSPLKFTAAYSDTTVAGFEPSAVLVDKVDRAKGWSPGKGGAGHDLVLTVARDGLPANIASWVVTIEQQSTQPQHTLGHFRLLATRDPRTAEHARTPADIRKLLASEDEKLTNDQRQKLADYFVRNIDPSLSSERGRLAELKKSLTDLKPNTVPILRELAGDKRRKTNIQHRGNFLDLGVEVTAGFPTAFRTGQDKGSADRLQLAEWLMTDQNPLTARVIANRFWEQIFGVGIVRTSEEFGSQGELPSHAELLDWLATEIVRQRWDMKQFVKLLVTSATYRQSSKVSAALAERDPENRLLARGPRVRLSAEMVRDQALHAAGLLSTKKFGPSVKPPRPNSGLNAAFGSGLDWQTSTGEDKYRRGLYTEWRRSSPYPSMVTFDAPNREVCTLRRNRTNTPLQALVTLNDPVYVEASQALARKMIAAGTSATDRARHGFRACLARLPRPVELDRLVQLFEQSRTEFAREPEKAAQLAGSSTGGTPASGNSAELAAWTVVANVLLNLDETLMKP